MTIPARIYLAFMTGMYGAAALCMLATLCIWASWLFE